MLTVEEIMNAKNYEKGLRELEAEESLSISPACSMPEKIFSGDSSRELWAEINSIDAMSSGDDIHRALYSICCALQKLEAKIDGH